MVKVYKTESERLFQSNNGMECMSVLKEAAFEVLLLHPGLDKAGFVKTLMEQYSIEVLDVYDQNDVVEKALAEMWDIDYLDTNTGEERTFNEWAKMLSTEAKIDEYYQRIKDSTHSKRKPNH